MAINGTGKWIIGLSATIILAVSLGAWGIYQAAGNAQHGAIERRVDKVETTMEQMVPDVAEIKSDIKYILRMIGGDK